MSTTIYYFSGSGNSLKIAKDLSALLGDVKLVQISQNNFSTINAASSNKIGIITPVIMSGIPSSVREFLEKLQVDKNTYIFTVVTMGGDIGITTKQIEDIINKKGAKLSADFGIVMPSNCQIMISPLSKEKQEHLFKKASEQVTEIAKKIENNELVNSNRNISIIKRALGGLVTGTFNPKNKDKNFWTTDKCIGCTTCSRVCPANNIKMVEGKPQWQHNCELCLSCMQWCPQKAIQYKKGTVKKGRYHNPNIKVAEIIKNR